MKKVAVIITLISLSLAHCTKTQNPILGKWKIDVEAFKNSEAYKATGKMGEIILKMFSETHLEFTDKKMIKILTIGEDKKRTESFDYQLIKNDGKTVELKILGEGSEAGRRKITVVTKDKLSLDQGPNEPTLILLRE